MVVCGKRQAPAALAAVKTRYPLYRRLSRPQGRSGRVWKISTPPLGPLIRYINYTILVLSGFKRLYAKHTEFNLLRKTSNWFS